jgi:hypothetical protein
MERLTKQCGNNRAVPTQFDLDFAFKTDDEAWKGLTDVFNLLAAYEDTGLTPEEITALRRPEPENKALTISAEFTQEEISELRHYLNPIKNNQSLDVHTRLAVSNLLYKFSGRAYARRPEQEDKP